MHKGRNFSGFQVTLNRIHVFYFPFFSSFLFYKNKGLPQKNPPPRDKGQAFKKKNALM